MGRDFRSPFVLCDGYYGGVAIGGQFGHRPSQKVLSRTGHAFGKTSFVGAALLRNLAMWVISSDKQSAFAFKGKMLGENVCLGCRKHA